MKALNLIRKPNAITSIKSNVTRSSGLQAKWLLMNSEPRWLTMPSAATVSDEQDLQLISETWNAIKRRMTNVMGKCEDQGTLRKLAVRMRIELADSLNNKNNSGSDEDEIVDLDMQKEDNERMWTLLNEIGAIIVNQAKYKSYIGFPFFFICKKI